MESYIQPIDTKILQSTSQNPGDSPLSGKSFDRLLKEKADGVTRPERNPLKKKENDDSAKVSSWTLDLLAQMLDQASMASSPEALGMNRASMEGLDFVPIEANGILQGQSDLAEKPLASEPGLGVSFPRGEDHLEDPFSLWAEKEMAQRPSSIPEAAKIEKGFHSKEPFDPYSLRNITAAWMGDGEPSIPHSMLSSSGRIEDIHFSRPTWAQDLPLELKETPIFQVEKSRSILSEGFSAERKGPESISQTDPSLPPQAPASTFAQGVSNAPSSHANATLRPRAISNPALFSFAEQVGAKVLWLASNDGGRIRLTLEPPELGSLVIEIQKEHNQVKATLIADNSMTKEILEAHQSHLQKSLEGDGFHLTQYDVFVQRDMGSFQNSDENWTSHHGPDSKDPLPPTPQADPTPGEENRTIGISGPLGFPTIDRWV
jgi:flagellar hook-length control protein FliK